MAKIVVSRCPGGEHIHFTITEAWGVHDIHGTRQEMSAAAKIRKDSDLLEDVKKTIRDSGAAGYAQQKAVVEAATYNDTSSDPEARDV